MIQTYDLAVVAYRNSLVDKLSERYESAQLADILSLIECAFLSGVAVCRKNERERIWDLLDTQRDKRFDSFPSLPSQVMRELIFEEPRE